MRDIFVKNDTIYVADFYNHRVVRWAPGASEGVVVAGGNGNGGDLNQTAYPSSVLVDDNNNIPFSDKALVIPLNIPLKFLI